MANAVYIDSGHSGTDPGAVGNGLQEATLNKRVAKGVVAALRRSGVRTYTDLAIGNPGASTSIPDSRKHPDVRLFVSQHHNSAGAKTARGIETYKTGTGRSRRFAALVHARLRAELRRMDSTWVDRGVKEAKGTRAEYIVTRSQGASILLENGFVSNVKDAAVFKRADYARRCAETTARAIVDFGRKEGLWANAYTPPAPPTVTAFQVFHADGSSHGRFRDLTEAMRRARVFVEKEGGASVKRGKFPSSTVR